MIAVVVAHLDSLSALLYLARKNPSIVTWSCGQDWYAVLGAISDSQHQHSAC